MKKINTIVLGVGGNVSQGILKVLRNSEIECRIVGACISPYSTGLYFCDEALICPYANSPDFIAWLCKTCNEKNIDIVFTGVEENIVEIKRNFDFFTSHTNARFVAADYDKILIGQDKLKTCEWLRDNGCNYPKFCPSGDAYLLKKFAEETGFPIIAKPRNGKSSKGILIIHDENELTENIFLNDYVFEEYIGSSDEEYTVGTYTDKNGNVMPLIIMQRVLFNGGTSYAKVVENKSVYSEAFKICKCFNSKGPLNIQMRVDKNGRPVCFELNVRFSGTTPIRSHFGFKDVEAMLKEYILNQPIDSCFDISFGECHRFINEVYLKNGALEQMKNCGKCEDMSLFFSGYERIEV